MPSSRAQPATAVSRAPSSGLGRRADLVRRAEGLPALGQQRDVGARRRRASDERLREPRDCRPASRRRGAGCRRCVGSRPHSRVTRDAPLPPHRRDRARGRRCRACRRGRPARAFPEPVGQHQLHRRPTARRTSSTASCAAAVLAAPPAEAGRAATSTGIPTSSSSTRAASRSAPAAATSGPGAFTTARRCATGSRRTSGRSAAARLPNGVTCRYVRGRLAGFRIAREAITVWRR